MLTVAAASREALRGAILLAVYAAGVGAPLSLMALFRDRFDLGRRWLRGREISLGPLRRHTTNLAAGLMFSFSAVARLDRRGVRGLVR